MHNQRRPPINFILSTVLILTLVTPTILPFQYAQAAVRAQSAETCGKWTLQLKSEGEDKRIESTPISGDPGENCQATFQINNKTGIPLGPLGSLGGYTFELRPTPSNAQIKWIPPGDPNGTTYLTPALSVDVQVIPLDSKASSTVYVYGSITAGSLTIDSAFRFFQAILELVPIPEGCLFPKEKLALFPLKASYILEPVVAMGLRGDFKGMRSELPLRFNEFVLLLVEYMEDTAGDCATYQIEEFVKGILGLAKRPIAVAKIVADYLAWFSVVLFDYFKYQGRPETLELVYAPSAPAAVCEANSIRTPFPGETPRRDSANIELLSQLGIWAFHVVVRGSYAYVVENKGLCIIEVTTAYNPTQVSYIEIPIDVAEVIAPVFLTSIAVDREYVYITYIDASTHGASDRGLLSATGLRIIDVSNPALPLVIGSYDTKGGFFDIAVTENFAFIADSHRGLEIFDISNKATPSSVGLHPAPDSGRTQTGYYNIEVQGKYAHAMEPFDADIIDVSNPATPVGVGSYEPARGDYNSIAVNGNHAFIGAGKVGLLVFDITNPTSPTQVGIWELYRGGIGFYVEVQGNYVSFDEGRGISIIDVSDPTKPIEVSFYHQWVGSVAIANDTFYVAYGDGLDIVRFKPP